MLIPCAPASKTPWAASSSSMWIRTYPWPFVRPPPPDWGASSFLTCLFAWFFLFILIIIGSLSNFNCSRSNGFLLYHIYVTDQSALLNLRLDQSVLLSSRFLHCRNFPAVQEFSCNPSPSLLQVQHRVLKSVTHDEAQGLGTSRGLHAFREEATCR